MFLLKASLQLALLFIVLTVASPVLPRIVASLDAGATAEAQQRDDTAVRAFSSIQIKTSDGRCLLVDKLSGDFRENLTPIRTAVCGSTEGQRWDVITAGKHIDVANSMLIVSTLTQACLNFDPRRAGGTQVLLFSCGGRADGGGLVTNSQLFAFNGSAGPLLLKPNNQAGSCLVEKANAVDIANCNATDPSQLFTFGDGASAVTSNHFSTRPSLATAVGTTVTAHDTPTSLPAGAVPVSRGGQLSPTAAAEAQQRDDTAVRAFNNVSVRAPNGQCLFADPTAGDFRKNLIPVGLVECAGSPNEKWDIITQGTHNDQPSSALVVSSLTQGCISFDGRREANDTVTIFSCGGRADGSGKTQADQLFSYAGELSFALAPVGEKKGTCILPGDGRLVSGECLGDGASLFSIFP